MLGGSYWHTHTFYMHRTAPTAKHYVKLQKLIRQALEETVVSYINSCAIKTQHKILVKLSMLLGKKYKYLFTKYLSVVLGFPDSSAGKESAVMQKTPVRFLG